MGRFGTAPDFADTKDPFASLQGRWISGQSIDIVGGRLCCVQ